MKGTLPILTRWARRAGIPEIFSCLPVLASPVQNIFSPHTFPFMCPHRPATWAVIRAGLPVSLFVSLGIPLIEKKL
jgi:hypothetical protein